MSKADRIARFFKQSPPDNSSSTVELRVLRLEERAETYREKEANDIVEVLKHAFKEFPTLESAEKTISFFENELPKMPLPMLMFISNMLQSAGRGGNPAQDMMNDQNMMDVAFRMAFEAERIADAFTSEDNQKYNLFKTGGILKLLETEEGILFKHRISAENEEAWRISSRLVPAAPILRTYAGKHAHERDVFSRYSGFPYAMTCHLLEAFPETVEDLVAQRFMIMATLNKNHILHGHPHTSNFTVEFVRKDAVRAYAKEHGVEVLDDTALRNPELINAMPYREGDIIFDPVEFVRRRAEYIAVVRVIDFDLAAVMHESHTVASLNEMEIEGGKLDEEEVRRFRMAAA